ERSTGTALFLSSSATGGAGGGDFAGGGDATAIASGLVHSDALLDVYANARGGDALGLISDAGSASISVDAVSTGGCDVYANGEAHGGNGTDGVAVHLVDAVRGDTTGLLFLQQLAEGGSGDHSGGAASSTLHKSGSFRELDLNVTAHAGVAIGNSDPARADGF